VPEVTLVSSVDGPSPDAPVLVPPPAGAATARAIPGSRLVVIRGASHPAHYETPGPVTNALLTHFQATAR